eukprot:137271_1
MASKRDIQEMLHPKSISTKDIQEMLVSMGFQPNYIQRAFRVYEKNYGHSYNVEVITEIIVRLQNKDKIKLNQKKSASKEPLKTLPTPFMLFSDEIRAHAKSEYPNTRSGPLLKIIGQKWRALSDEEKASYQKEADRLREHTNTNNPPWKQIDIVKALLWNSDGKSMGWIASQLGRTINDVTTQILVKNKQNKETFPRCANEEIHNKYCIDEWLEVQDTKTLQWIPGTVVDKGNNWICVHYDGWPLDNERIHVIKHARRLRALGAALGGETQEEHDIREEMESFLVELGQLNWKLLTVDADASLYRCFAINIYSDMNQHMLVRRDCCQYMIQNKSFFDGMREKEAENE